MRCPSWAAGAAWILLGLSACADKDGTRIGADRPPNTPTGGTGNKPGTPGGGGPRVEDGDRSDVGTSNPGGSEGPGDPAPPRLAIACPSGPQDCDRLDAELLDCVTLDFGIRGPDHSCDLVLELRNSLPGRNPLQVD